MTTVTYDPTNSDVVNDESVPADASNDNISFASLSMGFQSLLNDLDTDLAGAFDLTFPTDSNGPRYARSSDTYVTLTADTPLAELGAATLTDIGGALFDGTQSAGITTADGDVIKLYSTYAGYTLDPALVGSVVFGVNDTDGSLAFILYLEKTDPTPDTTTTSDAYSVQTAIFQPLDNGDPMTDDESVSLDGVLHITAEEGFLIQFGNAPSASVLWIAFGEAGADGLAIVANGRNPNPDKLPAGDTTNTSQGGILDATLGTNSQGMTFPDALYFTYVVGYDENAPIAGDYTNKAFKDASLLQFDDLFTTDTASVVISQAVGSETQGMRLTALYTDTNADNVTDPDDAEEGELFFDELGSADDPDDTGNGDDIEVEITRVKVFWLADPALVGSVAGETIAEVSVELSLFNNDSPPGVIGMDTDPTTGVVVKIWSDGTATIDGFDAGMQIQFDANDHNRVLMEATSGKWDPGAFGFSQSLTDPEPLNGVIFKDDAPTVSVDAKTANLSLELDETIDDANDGPNEFDTYADATPGPEETAEIAPNGDADDNGTVVGPTLVTTANSSLAIGTGTTGTLDSLFTVGTPDYGADGAETTAGQTAYKETLSFVLSLDGVATNLVVTPLDTPDLTGLTDAADRTVHLFKTSDTEIVGVIKGGDGVFGGVEDDDYVAVRMTLNNSGDLDTATVTTEQYLPFLHTDANVHDQNLVLTLASGETLDVKLVVDVQDEDGDKRSFDDSVTIIGDTPASSFQSFDDDGPKVDIDASGSTAAFDALKKTLDETIGATDNVNEDGELAYGNSDDDDVAGNTGPVWKSNPAPGEAIGEHTTEGGSVGALFTYSGPTVADYGTDGKRTGTTTPDRTDTLGFAEFASPIETNLSATKTGGLSTVDATGRKLYFVWESATQIDVVALNGAGDLDDVVVLRILLNNSASPNSASLTYQQFAPVEQSDANLHDQLVALKVASTSDAKVEVELKTQIWDGDGDTDIDTATVTLFDKQTSILSVEDDGPNLTIAANATNVVHDETPGVQGAPDDDVAFGGLPAAVQTAFGAVVQPGVDGDVSAMDNGAIGFAASGGSLVDTSIKSAGTDGEKSLVYSLDLGSATSGISTTDGKPIVLGVEGDLIVGRIDDNGVAGIQNTANGALADSAAIAIAINADTGEIYTAQWLSVLSTKVDQDDEIEFLDKDAVKVKLTLTDNDNDTDIELLGVGDRIGFADDIPAITASWNETNISVSLDETIDPDDDVIDGYDTYSTTDTVEVPPDGDLDDNGSVSGPTISTTTTSAQAIGSKTSGTLSSLFNVGTPAFGADGADSAFDTDGYKETLSLDLSTDGVSTNLVVTELHTSALSGLSDAERTIVLHEVSSTEIIGTTSTGGYVALRILLNNPGDLSTATITTEQYLPFEHGTTTTFDEDISLILADGTLDLKLLVEIQDGDQDNKSAMATATLVGTTEQSSYASFEDDGPRLSLAENTGAEVIHDETPGDDEDDDDDFAALVSDLFAGVVQKGKDGDVLDGNLTTNDALGYARSGAGTALVTATALFGMDGKALAADQVYSLSLSGSEPMNSGLKTTEGQTIWFTLENGLIVGRVDDNGVFGIQSNANGSPADTAAIAFAINQTTGEVYSAQWLSIDSPNDGLADEIARVDIGTVSVVVTIKDGDGDVLSKSKDVSLQLGFADDAPVLGAIPDGNSGTPIPMEDLATPEIEETFNWNAGSDGGDLVFTDWGIGGLVSTMFPAAWTGAFGAITASGVGTDTITFTYAGSASVSGPGTLFEIKLVDDDPTDGLAKYQFDIQQDAPIRLSGLDISGFPSGNPVETITLETLNPNDDLAVEFNGLIFDDKPTSITDFLNGDIPDPDVGNPSTAEKQDNLNRDTNGFGVFSDGSSLMNDLEGMVTVFRDGSGQAVQEQGLQFVLNQNGGTSAVRIDLIAVNTLTGASETEFINLAPLTKGGQAAVDNFTLITDDLLNAADWDGNGSIEGSEEFGVVTLDTLDAFDTVYFVFTFPDGGSNAGVRIKKVNVVQQDVLPDVELAFQVQGEDDDGDDSGLQDFSIFLDGDGSFA